VRRRSVVRTPGKCEIQTTHSVSGGSSPSGEPDTPFIPPSFPFSLVLTALGFLHMLPVLQWLGMLTVSTFSVF